MRISRGFLAALLLLTGCRTHDRTAEGRASAVVVNASAGGSLVIRTSVAEFNILPSGYVQAYLVKGTNRLTLDEPQAAEPGDYVVSGGKPIGDFTPDFAHAQVTDAHGKLGTNGKRVEITSRSSATGMEKTLAVEVYDDFPNLAVTTLAYKNIGAADLKLDQVIAGRHRLNAALTDPKSAPYGLWSFQGSSYDWGKDEILPLSQTFDQPNMMGGPGPKGLGGGIPVIDFWTSGVGEAFGHLETVPLVLALPVKVEA